MKIALSAGHYPASPGAVFGPIVEHAVALDWVATLKPMLESYGFDVFMVPTGGLTAKVGAINAENCDCAIEIHFNSDPNHVGKGCETLYMPGSQAGEELARIMQKHLTVICQPDRGIKEGWYRMDRPGHVDFPGDVDGDEVVDAFLRLTHCPAIIVEPFFIHELGVLAMRASACTELARGFAEFAEFAHAMP